MFIGYYINIKINSNFFCSLLHLLVNRITFQVSGSGIGVDHPGMISFNGLSPANTGKDRFSSPGKTSKIMRNYYPGGNDKIYIRDNRVNPELITAFQIT